MVDLEGTTEKARDFVWNNISYPYHVARICLHTRSDSSEISFEEWKDTKNRFEEECRGIESRLGTRIKNPPKQFVRRFVRNSLSRLKKREFIDFQDREFTYIENNLVYDIDLGRLIELVSSRAYDFFEKAEESDVFYHEVVLSPRDSKKALHEVNNILEIMRKSIVPIIMKQKFPDREFPESKKFPKLIYEYSKVIESFFTYSKEDLQALVWIQDFDTKPLYPTIDSLFKRKTNRISSNDIAVDFLSELISFLASPSLSSPYSEMCHDALLLLREEFFPMYFDSIRLELNKDIFKEISDRTNVCVFGPSGSYKEASLLYSVDDSIDLLSINAYRKEAFVDTIGKAILVDAEGGSETGEKKRYLVVDGIVGEHLNNIVREGDRGLDWRPSLFLKILMHARDKAIPYLFVNTEHSGIQTEAEDFVSFIAEYAFERSVKIDKDSGLEYTHWLEKKPLPKKLIKEIRLNKDYNGEQYLDTWYQYNKQILGKERPQWNLGHGYCKGIELNVEQELELIEAAINQQDSGICTD